ncbi:MAG: arabinan endo-1,5-alpha-L-arabinosidase [Verrucomicrobiota bacterium]|nr:arabinan endo-1,5-alpha-L-arabinosidase [Verrucomicrobiota bacterium]
MRDFKIVEAPRAHNLNAKTVVARARICLYAALGLCVLPARAFEPVRGGLERVHDPSTLTRCDGRYYLFVTGRGIPSMSSADKTNWVAGPPVFSTPPSWTTNTIRGFHGYFWAPDLLRLNGRYYLYYAVSTFGSQTSAIGLATNPTLDPRNPKYQWTDRGLVVQSSPRVNFNAIDPSLLRDRRGRLWMSFGSYWSGIKLTELDPKTGKRLAPDSPIYPLAWHRRIEASYLFYRDGFYYLFVNWGQCCQGVFSTYNIRVGRGRAVTGPYLDRTGTDLLDDGGTLFLKSSGRYIGPGHMGILTEGRTDWFTCHYYDGKDSGRPKLGLGRLAWTADGWPVYTNRDGENPARSVSPPGQK